VTGTVLFVTVTPIARSWIVAVIPSGTDPGGRDTYATSPPGPLPS